MTKTTAEELARVIRWHIASTIEHDVLSGQLTDGELNALAQAILASPVIAKIERAAAEKAINSLIIRIEGGGGGGGIKAGEHKEKAGG